MSDLGIERIALCGDSAGGGLALALLVETARGLHPPAAAAVMSPWIDLSLSGASMETRSATDPLLSHKALAAAARLYLDGTNPRDPRASALNADLVDLPPVRIDVGDAEVLLDDAVRFAERAEAEGSVCEVHVWEGMVHVFPSNVQMLRAAGEALDDVGAFLCARLREEVAA